MSNRPRKAKAITALAIAAALTVLTACSSGTADNTSETGGSATAGTHAVEHARGVSDVPLSPQRVVVLEPVELDTAVALDVIPVGTAVLSQKTGVPAYLGEKAASIEMVGTVPEPNLEAIAALAPDLILGTDSRHMELYDKLSGIAPTVFLADHAAPWQENVQLVAKALNKTAEADALLAAYEDRCAEIAAEFDTAGQTAQLVRPRKGLLTLYGPTSFAGGTLECAGFTTPARDWENSISVDLSPELASQAQADLVLVTSADPSDPSTMPVEMTANAELMPNTHLVDMSFWITGVGPLGGQTVLDDLARILGENANG
ncbi:ABC transporter substrate-binding protein [Tomitella biformata]|uniref:ABC transporter substrate-binding protein n=1 Tax=Tomitella biformata TaxID=630403 RepID=UPI00046688CE|nr:iron-siderophore ABC transporter substrate-binding protein [Tomitella biformata]